MTDIEQLRQQLMYKDKLIELLSKELLETEKAIKAKTADTKSYFNYKQETLDSYNKDTDYLEPVKKYLLNHPDISIADAADALGCSELTVKRGITCLGKTY